MNEDIALGIILGLIVCSAGWVWIIRDLDKDTKKTMDSIRRDAEFWKKMYFNRTPINKD
jgi:hypothetical protein